MFDKTIEFISHNDYVDQKLDYPTPIKLNIPEWFKKLNHSVEKQTIKGCMPFLDTLTSGYLLRVPQDYGFQFRDDNGKRTFEWHPPQIDQNQIMARGINLTGQNPELHDPRQLEGSANVEKNKNMSILKIMNPWIIKTPPGYSCLFLPPMNNTDDRFSIIPGIVDTDTFTNEINFPIIVNGDKYPYIDTIIKRGTPYVQVIPYKRESWKMKITGKNTNDFNKGKIFYQLDLLRKYKNRFWNKKSWT